MAVRMIAVVLAVVAATGLAAPTALASHEVASQVDDGTLAPEPVIVTALVAHEAPALREGVAVVGPPADARGRLHQTRVFRPPCRIAPR